MLDADINKWLDEKKCILNESNMTVSKKIIFSKLTNEEPTIYDQMMMS